MYERVCGFEWGAELIKKDTVVVLLSTAVGIGIATIIIFFVVWIGFPADNPRESFKDALGFAGGIFGGLATFGAAIVAAHLFNDWREEADFHARKDFAAPVLGLLASIKYELVWFQEILINLEFIDNYAFLNTEYKEYICFNPKKDIFKLSPNIKYLNKYKSKTDDVDLSKEYASLERHIAQIRVDLNILLDSYQSYYNKVIEEGGLSKSNIYSQPHSTYKDLNIEKPANEIKILKKIMSNETGFYTLQDKKKELIKYSNLKEMIEFTITTVDKIESFILTKQLILKH